MSAEPSQKSLSGRLLYGILDLGYVAAKNAVAMAQKMIDGGIDVIQLRAKSCDVAAIRALAEQLIPICRAASVPFILNDHPHLAAEVGADGLHVGQDDMPVAEVRKIVGARAIVGLSTHSVAQAVAAADAGPDYIGFGPLFATPTKPDYRPVGLGDMAEVHHRVSLPIFCIGGIKRENLPAVIRAGARRAVIVSGILLAEDPASYARRCRELLAGS